ncbi:alpha/beta fold hydrolase [Alkalibacterium pelagium]|uniref:Pimeloyl-ACP methyl ester carboxylesterase n=1 Tax=Alkalibacterium pelagium TaxID=426702 RepID=A0A1H7KGC1_9LACT|nr:alpha/beta hydrolase [Alkalibacterium pelagium]GEN50755.1 alpha/beta hydrolase [Alkalibacterium pelagium]SEK85839.1 Pimeloyl-ACP methyl ester carboxylesterase [Alkalibacterium pelagium]
MEAFEHETVNVNGIDLHVVQHGPKDGEVMLFLHGFPEFWYGWHKQIDYFAAEGYRVWAPDQRGYNLSDKPEAVENYEMTHLVDDVVGLIKASGKSKVILVGHDWGGIVAWRVAREYPELIEKMIILNAPHSGALKKQIARHPGQLLKSSYILFFQLQGIPEQFLLSSDGENAAGALQMTSTPGAFSGQDLEAYRKAWAQPNAMRSMLNWYRANAKSMASSNLPKRVKVPTLILWGAKDQFLGKEMAVNSLDFCDDGRGILLGEATHWLHHEEPEQINTLIGEFVDGHMDR